MHVNRNPNRRGGFTLLELLVVMAVILTLAGLLLAGIFRALVVASKLQQISEIKSLHEAVSAFKTHFDVPYMPSKITISSTPSGMPPEDVAYIRRLYPSPAFWDNWNSGQINWGVDGQLEGPQCLVFFLGGPQAGGKPQGWSTNPSNPTLGGNRRVFFDFPAQRLKGSPMGLGLVFMVKDADVPYAYFSTRGTLNSYDPGDCISTLDGVTPYSDGKGGFMNADTYQIIGPGIDGFYGKSGLSWSPQLAAGIYPHRSEGADDLANFYGTNVLGSSAR